MFLTRRDVSQGELNAATRNYEALIADLKDQVKRMCVQAYACADQQGSKSKLHFFCAIIISMSRGVCHDKTPLLVRSRRWQIRCALHRCTRTSSDVRWLRRRQVCVCVSTCWSLQCFALSFLRVSLNMYESMRARTHTHMYRRSATTQRDSVMRWKQSCRLSKKSVTLR